MGRRFEPGATDRAWVADAMDFATSEGRLCLAAVGDLDSWRMVTRTVFGRNDGCLVVAGLEMVTSRRLLDAGLVAHSDWGGQYAHEHHRRALADCKITCRLSRRADCRDKVPMEWFFASLAVDLVHDEDYDMRAEANVSLFEYIEVFDNQFREHSSLGYRPPAESEPAG